MKTFLVLILAALALLRASAQVSVELMLDQEQFLPSESVPVAVKITNRSGQRLHFGETANWLTFNVESTDSFVVNRSGDVPVTGEFDLESSQLAIKRVDLAPYFSLAKHGRYKLTATLRIREWAAQVVSPVKFFDVISGAKIWSQDFGVPVTGGPPEVRRFTLEQANYLRTQLRLYVQVSDAAEARIFKVTALGPMVAFGQPEAQVDRTSQLHVLWQTGAQSFSYSIVNLAGTVVSQNYYDNFNSRPRLTVNENGEVVEVGGTRRMKPAELPVVRSPNELPAVKSPEELPHTVAPAKADAGGKAR